MLIAADAAISYRTSLLLGSHYDESLVCRAIARDIEKHGAPLVYRLDRARAHSAPAVRAMLAAHSVLALHGPPHCPRFYGQLERQNREHRAWLGDVTDMTAEELERYLATMLEALNGAWRRRKLGWQTASEAWASRPIARIDRSEFAEDVNERQARLARNPQLRGNPVDLARRLAIEQALEARGLLVQSAWTSAK